MFLMSVEILNLNFTRSDFVDSFRINIIARTGDVKAEKQLKINTFK